MENASYVDIFPDADVFGRMALSFDPSTLRAARVLAGLTQEDLARLLKISVPFLRKAETTPEKVTIETLEKIKVALEEQGIVFIHENAGEGPGIRRRKPNENKPDTRSKDG
ncbi:MULTISPECIES: helix-turn-helix domain-containing protein [Agrobacterium]|uniref:helix-turn-helix domain-containing protein n=1 Tax=Agrobacterium TaxID=357 RepID=UPI000D3952D4|nr:MULTISPECIES: helix-turn-helix transcriptional regulator [Agrobacterium]PTV72479.1 hypothetical protein DBL06_20060 [Agrobacterium pusense]TZG36569.1 helix-turn-helix transcriptional regulator [Agrobacterium sp. B1(2019)]